MEVLSDLSASRDCLMLVSWSLRPTRLTSRSASSPLSSVFSAATNCSFSLKWVSTCAEVLIFLRSLSSSSLRSSIFSLSVWFSILSCSKSMRCRPSASFSFCLRVCSSLSFWLRRAMWVRRILASSESRARSLSSKWRMSLGAMGRPVREFSAAVMISRLNSAKASAISCALSSLWVSTPCISAACASYLSCTALSWALRVCSCASAFT
mmetsp:Transcript_1322/g.3806  ORF Transcript_1322/g.3806 Transcript_1322/m.3806 type:complete len:209 (+) Transcript_1322:257-883(+)